jgi:hypothetical protein
MVLYLQGALAVRRDRQFSLALVACYLMLLQVLPGGLAPSPRTQSTVFARPEKRDEITCDGMRISTVNATLATSLLFSTFQISILVA